MGIPDRGTDVVPWVAKVTDNCGRAHAPRRSASWSSLAQAPRIISLSLPNPWWLDRDPGDV